MRMDAAKKVLWLLSVGIALACILAIMMTLFPRDVKAFVESNLPQTLGSMALSLLPAERGPAPSAGLPAAKGERRAHLRAPRQPYEYAAVWKAIKGRKPVTRIVKPPPPPPEPETEDKVDVGPVLAQELKDKLSVQMISIRTSLLFDMEAEREAGLSEGTIPRELSEGLEKSGHPLGGEARLSSHPKGALWYVRDGVATYLVRKQEDALNVYGVSQDPKRTFALITLAGGKHQEPRVCGPGHTFDDIGAVILRLLPADGEKPARVVFDYKGKEVEVAPAASAKKTSKKGARSSSHPTRPSKGRPPRLERPSTRPSPSRSGSRAAGNQVPPKLARQVGANQFEVGEESLRAYCREHQLELMRQVAPHIKDFKPSGLVLKTFTRSSVLGQFGLQPGDIITSVNGESVAGPAQALKVAATFSGPTARVGLLRKGKPVTLTVTLTK